MRGVQAEAGAAFSHWRAAAGRAFEETPAWLRAQAERSFVAIEDRQGPGLRWLSHLLAAGGLILPVGVFLSALAAHHGSFLSACNDAALPGICLFYLLLLAAAVLASLPRWMRVDVPRLRMARAARRSLSRDAAGLALSFHLFPNLEEEEQQARAWCWWRLEQAAAELARAGEPAAAVMRPDRALDSVALEGLLLAARLLSLGLYQAGLLQLWSPAWQLALQHLRHQTGPLAWSPFTPALLFLFAFAVPWLVRAGVRAWVGCDPAECQRLALEMGLLAEANQLRELSFRVLTREGEEALTEACRALEEAPSSPPLPASGWGRLVARVVRWLTSEGDEPAPVPRPGEG